MAHGGTLHAQQQQQQHQPQTPAVPLQVFQVRAFKSLQLIARERRSGMVAGGQLQCALGV